MGFELVHLHGVGGPRSFMLCACSVGLESFQFQALSKTRLLPFHRSRCQRDQQSQPRPRGETKHRRTSCATTQQLLKKGRWRSPWGGASCWTEPRSLRTLGLFSAFCLEVGALGSSLNEIDSLRWSVSATLTHIMSKLVGVRCVGESLMYAKMSFEDRHAVSMLRAFGVHGPDVYSYFY